MDAIIVPPGVDLGGAGLIDQMVPRTTLGAGVFVASFENGRDMDPANTQHTPHQPALPPPPAGPLAIEDDPATREPAANRHKGELVQVEQDEAAAASDPSLTLESLATLLKMPCQRPVVLSQQIEPNHGRIPFEIVCVPHLERTHSQWPEGKPPAKVLVFGKFICLKLMQSDSTVEALLTSSHTFASSGTSSTTPLTAWFPGPPPPANARDTTSDPLTLPNIPRKF